jgi:predicted outer membrane repeat protein
VGRAATVMLAAVLIVFAHPHALSGRTWYIAPDGSGDAPTIQAGIDSAAAGDSVLLADGVYTGEGNRDINFRGKAMVVTSCAGSPAGCVIDCQGGEQGSFRGFTFRTGEGLESVLEAVTIERGYKGLGGSGGGILCSGASPTIRNVVLYNNHASGGGGLACDSAACPSIEDVTFSGNHSEGFGGAGIWCRRASSPRLENVVFSGNDAGYFGIGGGMSCIEGSAPALVNVVFVENFGAYGGGGIYCEDSSPTLEAVRFDGNKSTGTSPPFPGGGGLYCYASSPLLSECVFLNNWAMSYGGGLACRSGSNPVLREVTFCANRAEYGAGVYCKDSSPTLDRVIVAFGGIAEGIYCYGGCNLTLRCCDIYGNAGGDWVGCVTDQYGTDGNFSADPLFCDMANGDLGVEECSPCMPGQHPDTFDCGGKIGAVGSGCGCGEGTVRTTWGTIKALYR